MKSSSILFLSTLAASVSAAWPRSPRAATTKHILYVGAYIQKNLYALEFDTEALTLKLINNITTPGAHTYTAFNHDKTVLYAVEQGGFWNSYDIAPGGQNLVHTARLPITGDCNSFTYPFLVASPVAPYNVYAAPYGNCGNVISTTANGTLDATTSLWNYAADPAAVTANVTHAIHGMDMAPDGSILYSADLTGNQVWAHSVDENTGAVELIQQLDSPIEKSGPRRLARTSHADGGYVYVLLEEAQKLLQYAIADDGKLELEREDLDIIPEGYNIHSYRGDSVRVTASGLYLWATTRAQIEGSPGFLSAFSLNGNGSVKEKLFTVPTATGGGFANFVSPAFFDDQWVAVAEAMNHSVSVWKFNAADKSAEIVATWYSVPEGMCCGNVAWYS